MIKEKYKLNNQIIKMIMIIIIFHYQIAFILKLFVKVSKEY